MNVSTPSIRHRCVYYPRLENKPKGQCDFTEYKDTYRKFLTYEPVGTSRPDSATKMSDQPLGADTSYKQDYISHELKPHPRREQARYVKPMVKVEDTSGYQHDYTEKFAHKRPSIRPSYTPSAVNQPFGDTTVNRETYRPWEFAMRHEIPPRPAIKLPTDKFNNQTTFQDDFKRHKGHHGREVIYIPALSITPGKFADETVTRRDYTEYDIVPLKSAKPLQNVIRHAGPSNYRTTFQNTYTWPDGRPASICKPLEINLSSEPLESDTTHNITYLAWNISKRQEVKPRSGWNAPTAPFDHTTTSKDDYDGKPSEPIKCARPDYRKIHPGEFHSLTTHKDEFKHWELNPREIIRPRGSQTISYEKFGGQTTFQKDFKPLQPCRAKPCTPKDGHVYRMDLNGDNLFSYDSCENGRGALPNVHPSMNGPVEVIG